MREFSDNRHLEFAVAHGNKLERAIALAKMGRRSELDAVLVCRHCGVKHGTFTFVKVDGEDVAVCSDCRDGNSILALKRRRLSLAERS